MKKSYLRHLWELTADQILLFQSFAMLSDKLEPLAEGVRRNKQHWLDVAAANKLTPATNHDRDAPEVEEAEEDEDNEPIVNSNTNTESSIPSTPNCEELVNHNCTTDAQSETNHSDS